MGKKRHTPEEIISKLRQVDVLVAQGTPVANAIRAGRAQDRASPDQSTNLPNVVFPDRLGTGRSLELQALFRSPAAWAACSGGSWHRAAGSDLDPWVELVWCPTRGDAGSAVCVRLALCTGRAHAGAAGLP